MPARFKTKCSQQAWQWMTCGFFWMRGGIWSTLTDKELGTRGKGCQSNYLSDAHPEQTHPPRKFTCSSQESYCLEGTRDTTNISIQMWVARMELYMEQECEPGSAVSGGGARREEARKPLESEVTPELSLEGWVGIWSLKKSKAFQEITGVNCAVGRGPDVWNHVVYLRKL